MAAPKKLPSFQKECLREVIRADGATVVHVYQKLTGCGGRDSKGVSIDRVDRALTGLVARGLLEEDYEGNLCWFLATDEGEAEGKIVFCKRCGEEFSGEEEMAYLEDNAYTCKDCALALAGKIG